MLSYNHFFLAVIMLTISHVGIINAIMKEIIASSSQINHATVMRVEAMREMNVMKLAPTYRESISFV